MKQEDTHFYIDNAPPKEVIEVLRVLSLQNGMTPGEISGLLLTKGIRMQKDYTYSPRRLFDLGLAEHAPPPAGRVTYLLSLAGLHLQRILNTEQSLAIDLLHFLHYSRFTGAPHDRKYLWSYRRCCQLIWDAGYLASPAQLAATIQSEMQEEFSALDFGARQGARFNKTAVSCVYTWLRTLLPSPIGADRTLVKREVGEIKLALLGLDFAYREQRYHYGDPILMSESLINKVAQVFFLDGQCCRRLMLAAETITDVVKIVDTLGGPSITLTRPITVEAV